MSTTVSVPKAGRISVPVLNSSTTAVIASGSVVFLATGTSPNEYKVTKVSTAGTVLRLFGVVEHQIATAGVGYCVIHGPAVALANSAITVKAPVTAVGGTAGVAGRVEAATAASTAGLADNGTYLGWSMGVGSTGAFVPIFVDTCHTPVA